MCALSLKPRRVLLKGCHVASQLRHKCDTSVSGVGGTVHSHMDRNGIMNVGTGIDARISVN